MKKTKVFFFCPALIAGGLERVLSVLSEPLANHYDEVTYITWHDREVFYEIDKNVRVVCVERECGSRSVWKRMRWVRGFVKKGRPDVFVAFSAPYNMIALASLIFVNVVVLVAERVDPASFRWGKHLMLLRNLLYKSAQGVIIQTESSRNHLSKSLQKKAIVLPNPIFMSSDMVGVAMKEDPKPIVVTATRLAKQKHLDMLINVFGKFIGNHPDYKLVIYGEGPERLNLEAIIKSKGLTNAVEMPGVTTHLWDEILYAKMFVLTSSYEGMSNSLIEAMCLGIPCVSTKVSGSVDYIKNGVNGCLIDIDDEDALLRNMNELAEHHDYARKLGRNAYRVYEEVNVDVVSKKWIDVISNYV